MAEKMSELNAVGNPDRILDSAEGGNTGRGPLQEFRPTGVVARGGMQSKEKKLRADTGLAKSKALLGSRK